MGSAIERVVYRAAVRRDIPSRCCPAAPIVLCGCCDRLKCDCCGAHVEVEHEEGRFYVR